MQNDEMREELRTIRQLLGQLLDVVQDMQAQNTVASPLAWPSAACCKEVPAPDHGGPAPAVPHTHTVDVKTEAQPQPAEDPGTAFSPEELAEPEPAAEPERKIPKDMQEMRMAIAEIVGGPSFTAEQKLALNKSFGAFGVAKLKDLPEESYGAFLDMFAGEVRHG